MSDVLIRAALVADVARLQEMDIAAGAQFAAVGHPEMDDGDCISSEVAAMAIAEGRLAVAVRHGAVVGYVLVDRCGSEYCVAQITVDPSAQQGGVGTLLMRFVLADAERSGETSVVLSTQSDVPWNRPWYEALGFEVVPPQQWSAGMERVTAAQMAAGLDWSTRVHMRFAVNR